MSDGFKPTRLNPEPVTRCERDVLRALERAIRKHGNPTYREVAELGGFTTPLVHRYLRKLELKGYVQTATRKHRQRSIRLLCAIPKLEKATR